MSSPGRERQARLQAGIDIGRMFSGSSPKSSAFVAVETGNSDETFFFFAGDPAPQPFVTRWSGGAAPPEEAAIQSWTVTHVAGMPAALAACFASHVTKDRDQ